MADLHPVHPAAAAGTCSPIADLAAYRSVIFQMLNDPDGFWLAAADRLDWDTAPRTAKDADGAWFADGTLGINDSGLDRHIFSRGDQPAVVWQGAKGQRRVTFQELFDQVGEFSSGLKMLGVQRGARVVLLMGSIPEMIIATLACARIGAVWMPLAPDTRADVLREQLDAFQPVAVITQDESRIPGRLVPTKNILDQALKKDGHSVQFVVVTPHTGGSVGWKMGMDIWWEHSTMGASAFCPSTPLPAATQQLVLPRQGGLSGHAIGGLLTWAAWSQAVVMDVRPGRMVACLDALHTLRGQSIGILATLSNGGTIALSETRQAAELPGGVDAMLGGLTGLSQQPRVVVVDGALPEARWWGLKDALPHSALVGSLSLADGFCLATFPPAIPGGPGLLGAPLPGHQALLLDEDGEIVRGPASGQLVIEINRPGAPAGRHDTGLRCTRDRHGYFSVSS